MDPQDFDYTRVPLVSLPDSLPAWLDNVPCLPGVSESEPIKPQNDTGKANGNVHDETVLSGDCGNAEKLSQLEKLKIKVINGKIKVHLSYGELKLLGCSSLGFVTGKLFIKSSFRRLLSRRKACLLIWSLPL